MKRDKDEVIVMVENDPHDQQRTQFKTDAERGWTCIIKRDALAKQVHLGVAV